MSTDLLNSPVSSHRADPGGGEKVHLRAAVVGTGKISEEHLKFLSGNPDVELLAVCDLSPALAQYSARRFGAKRFFTDYAQMLAETSPNVVHVLTPASTHLMVTMDCLNAGAHVIVEKPAALNGADLEQLRKVANRCGKRVIEDHNYRFNRPILAIESAIAAGKLGEVRDVEIRMALNIRGAGGRYSDENLPNPSHKLPAGVIHEFITHLAYLMLRFVPEIEKVRAAWNNHGGGDIFKYDDLDALVFGEQAHGRIRFSCMTSPDTFTIIVRGSAGWAETDLFQPYLRLVTQRPGGKLSPLVNHLINGCSMAGSSVVGFKDKVLQQTAYEGLQTFLSKTYSALRNGTEPPVSFSDTEHACRLVDALLDPGNRI
jgi:predicted dehydrogenase